MRPLFKGVAFLDLYYKVFLGCAEGTPGAWRFLWLLLDGFKRLNYVLSLNPHIYYIDRRRIMISRLELRDVLWVITHQFLPLSLLVVLDALEDGLDLVMRHLWRGYMQEHFI